MKEVIFICRTLSKNSFGSSAKTNHQNSARRNPGSFAEGFFNPKIIFFQTIFEIVLNSWRKTFSSAVRTALLVYRVKFFKDKFKLFLKAGFPARTFGLPTQKYGHGFQTRRPRVQKIMSRKQIFFTEKVLKLYYLVIFRAECLQPREDALDSFVKTAFSSSRGTNSRFFHKILILYFFGNFSELFWDLEQNNSGSVVETAFEKTGGSISRK